MSEMFPKPICGWLERSPKAQRAVERLRADLDALVARLESAIPHEVRDAIAARIDPPAKAPTPIGDTGPAASGSPDSEPPPAGTPR